MVLSTLKLYGTSDTIGSSTCTERGRGREGGREREEGQEGGRVSERERERGRVRENVGVWERMKDERVTLEIK